MPSFGTPQPAAISRGRRLWVTGAIAAVWLLAAVDRNILSVLLVPIQKDLGVSDTAMGALTGIAFSLVYATAALPLARLADRSSRRNLLAAAVAFWSVMTAACGLAANYAQLLAARVGVALGESAHAPTTMSMMGDLYPAQHRGKALSALSIGAALGFSAGAWLAGVLNDRYNWHIALLAVGAPGLILALLILFTVPEPTRGAQEGGLGDDASSRTTLGSLRRIVRIPSFLPLVLGMILLNTAFLGWLAWVPAFLMRTHHLTTSQMSALFGAIVATGPLLANVMAGLIGDRLAARGVRWRMYFICWMMIVSAPILAASILVPQLSAAIALMVLYTLTSGGLSSASAAAMLSIAPPAMRAFMAALIGLAVSVFGGGLAPLLMGAVSDALAPSFGVGSIRYAMLVAPTAMALAAAMFWWASRTAEADAAAAIHGPGLAPEPMIA